MKKFFVGADVSKKTLDCVLYDANVEKMKTTNYLKINNDKSGCEQLVNWIKQLGIAKKDVIVCMEYTGDYSFRFAEFLDWKKVDFTMIQALKIKRAFAGSRGKNDKVDAIRIAQYAYTYREQLKPADLRDKSIVKLRDLMNDRKLAVNEMAKYKTVMANTKDRQGSSRYKRAKKCLEFGMKMKREIEKEIRELINSDDSLKKNYELMCSIPGVSLVNAVNLIIFTGNFTLFKDGRKFATYCGVAPFEYTSGTSVNWGTHVSKMANKMLKADLSMAAKAAINHDSDLKTYYERKRSVGKSFGCVLNAVKCKIIYRVFAVIHRGTPYVNTMGYLS